MIKLLDILSEGPQIGKRPVRTYKLVQGKETELDKVKNPKVVDYIKKNPENINIEDLAKFLSVREQVALQYINALKQVGALVSKDGTTSKPMSSDDVDDLFKEATFTDKHDDNPKLKGGQKDLPDEVQAKIVAKEGYDEFDMEDEGPDYNSVSDLEDELRRLVRWSNQYGSKGADSKIEQLKKRIEDLKKSPVNEGEDHEVSMAQNSLKSIIKSAIELHAKLGNMERDIPGWIQDHITNAENYIDQAAQGFHELNDNE
jgi:hypothetical protein